MRISRQTTQILRTLAFALVLAGVSNGFGNAAKATHPPQEKATQHTISEGQRVEKFRGIVAKREPDWFTMGDTMGGPQTTVLLTPTTEVKSHKRGLFRGSKNYGESFILRGLRLEVDGVGNSQGQLVAEKIRFDEQDLRTAQALKSTVDPVEAEMREKLKQQQAEQERLAAQLEETQAVATAAREDAAKAQATADM